MKKRLHLLSWQSTATLRLCAVGFLRSRHIPGVATTHGHRLSAHRAVFVLRCLHALRFL